MPTTYAHDLFGKKIYAKLPAEIQKVIRRNTNLYRIGLHGPDILFYDMLKPKVTETGIAMHRECAAPFFERGMTLVRTTHDENYLLICSDLDVTIFLTVPVIHSFTRWLNAMSSHIPCLKKNLTER